MKIGTQEVNTFNAGNDMRDKIVKLFNSRGYVERNSWVRVIEWSGDEQEELEAENIKVINLDDYETAETFSGKTFVGFCGNMNVYVYKN